MTTVRHRHERVAEEIRHELEAMLAGELKDPRLAGPVRIAEVTVTPDLKHARIFLAAFGTNEERRGVREGLAAALGFIRSELAQRLDLRRAPEIHFVVDSSGVEGVRLEELLHRPPEPDKDAS
ncbi:MAG TPA: 30S ribosome-binding factor RbfA [Candidatus Acidoferrales bacterium]|nr:30S ribosome-binding factor RbfA [Candidatus Acidoferrales bacterium]